MVTGTPVQARELGCMDFFNHFIYIPFIKCFYNLSSSSAKNAEYSLEDKASSFYANCNKSEDNDGA